MKSGIWKFVALPVLILLLPFAIVTTGLSETHPARDSMSMWQARRIILAAFDHVQIETARFVYHKESVSRGSIQFARDSIEFDGVDAKDRTKHHRIDLKTLQIVSSKCWPNNFDLGNGVIAKGACELKAESQDRDTRKLFDSLFLEGTGDLHGDVLRNTAEALAAAFNRLHALAVSVDDRAVSFHQQAAAWRALASKPPVPEAVRVERLLAEDALKNRHPEEALEHYEKGVALCLTWPQGYFNAALIAAQLGFYNEAVVQMQSYLELLPDAKDAQAARDQIVIWQYKAKQNSTN
jgi:hypothetical protein